MNDPASTTRPDSGTGSRDSTHLRAVQRYYRAPESRLGYRWVLGGTKHFGYYRPGDAPWRFSAAMRRMEDLLADRLRLEPGAQVLDAGCGMGDVAYRLASVHHLDVTGIDILDWNVAEARRRAAARGVADRARFELMDYAALTFPADHFDGAYTMETLVHSDRVEQVLSGLHRVLRPGGSLVHFEYSREPEATTSARSSQVLREVNEVAAMPAFQRLHHGKLEQLLTEAGFVDVVAEDITDRMLPMLRMFALMGWPAYALAQLLRRPHRAINAMSGVEFYRHQDCWRYKVVTCRKPGETRS